MSNDFLNSIILNSVFLVGLAVVYNFIPKENNKYKYLIQVAIGLVLGYFLTQVLKNPLVLADGVILDTRSVFVSITAIFFAPISAVIVIIAGALYRIFVVGGGGTIPGVLLVFIAGGLGMLFKKYRFKFLRIGFWRRTLEFSLFTIVLHLLMISLFLFLPNEDKYELMRKIAFQVLFVMPLLSVSISTLIYITYDNHIKNIQLLKTQEQFVKAIEDAPVPIAIHSENGRIVTFNKEWTKATGYNLHNAANIPIWVEKAFKENAIPALKRIDELSRLEDNIFKDEIRFYTSKNRKVTWDFHVSSIGTTPDNKKLIMSIANDVTEKKKLEKELVNLSFKDKLTGLYNRRFFEEELERLNVKRNYPLSIVFVDVNSLKLTNDAFGHNEGDKLLKQSADVFKKSFREDDIIARVGGDEFVVILPKTDHETTVALIDRVTDNLKGKKIKNIQISLAMGSYTSTTMKLDINRAYSLAEEHMYQNKLTMSKTVKENAINVILNALFRSDPSQKTHALEVSELCEQMGKALDMDDSQINILKKAGYLHDIGKIVINKSILKKKTDLDEIEALEIKKHPETGYRILNNGYNLTTYATIVLDHHERWDGAGYPQKKRGKTISYEARIIAICDAFSSMTSINSYRTDKLNISQAIDEIVRKKGSQFDPELVDLFVSKIAREY